MNTLSSVTQAAASSDKSFAGIPRHMLALLDSVAAALAFVGSAFLVVQHATPDANPRIAHLISLCLLNLLVLLLVYRDGQYSVLRRLSRIDDAACVLKNIALSYVLTMGAVFATKGFFTGYGSLSRKAILVDLGSLLVLMVAARWGMWAVQRARLVQGVGVTRAVIVGDGTPAQDFLRFLDKRPWLGVTCAGRLSFADDEDQPSGEERRSVPCVGTVDDIAEALRSCNATQVIVALDTHEVGHLPRITSELALSGVAYHFVPSLFEYTYHAAKLAGFAELPVIDMHVDSLDRVQRTLKRALDLTVAACAVVFGAPLWLPVAIAVKLSSPGPILFRQERVGYKGRHFEMLKFRTMYRDAEERLAELHGENEADGHIFKMKADPRVTPVGRFLRRWSMDEIPQVLNVLRGEMSVVGPRPPRPQEVEHYETEHLCRLKGTPGMTGLWQVSGRSDLTFEEMVRLDRFYLANWSIGLDLKILLRTVYVVPARKGAY